MKLILKGDIVILKEIRIRNFRPFRDVSIDFAHGDKNITIIRGNKSTGITALINAICWCLYGYEIQPDDGHLPICNNKAAHLAGYGDEIEVSVELIFDDNGELLFFRRVQGFRKDFGKLIKSYDHLKVREQKENDILISDEAQFAIEKRIPRKLMNYFLLDNYNIKFNRYEIKRILDMFSDFSQINILKNVISHLDMVKDFYISEIEKFSVGIRKEYEGKKFLEDKLQEAESKKKDYLKSKEDIQNRINSKKKKLASMDSDVSKLLQRKIDLQNSINTNSSDLEKLEEQLNKHVLTKYPYVLSYDLFNFIDLCEKSQDTTLDISEFKEETTKDVKEFKDISGDLHKKIHEITHERENNINELREIEYMLSSVEKLSVELLLKSYNRCIKHKQKIDMGILSLSQEIKYIKDSLKAETNKEILFENKIKFDEHWGKVKFCEESKKVAEDILARFNEDAIRKLETEINNIFPKNYFKDQLLEIIINENSELIIKNYHGTRLNFNDLSNTEQSLLELSFAAALNKILGINLPIIIDFPSWFDTYTKNHMFNSFIDLNHDNQIILFITTGGDEFVDVISRHSKMYELRYKITEEGEESKVVLDD